MASESSSAVLELTDGDVDDQEAATPMVTDDVPLIMEHGYDIAVKVDAPIKQLSTLETFVSYRVRCACARWSNIPAHVRRRYNHFKLLHKRLQAAYPLIAVPPLPPLHSAKQQLDRYSAAFVCVRTLALHALLDRIAKHPILTHSEDFRLFCTIPDEDFEKVFKSENRALNLWGLSSALYGGSSDSKPTNGARVKDPEFSSLCDYLTSLQQKLTTLCSLSTKLYKGSSGLANDCLGLQRCTEAWSCSAGGRVSLAARGVGAGAGAAHLASSRLRPPVRSRALLPFLAAYAGAQADKIRQRDAIHAAHVASSSDDIHNRLTLASEALRSELADWTPKTHADIKSLLLEMADRQVTMLTQVLMGWEHALRLSNEANVDELFKTVSKTAVQNLSPSKCKADVTPNETDKDFDDLDNFSDSDIQESRTQINDRNDDLKESDTSLFDSEIFGQKSDLDGQSDAQKCDEVDNFGPKSDLDQDSDFSGQKVVVSDLKKETEVMGESDDSEQKSEKGKTNGEESDQNGQVSEKTEDISDGKSPRVDSFGESKETNGSKREFTDPLHDFAEVDLSS